MHCHAAILTEEDSSVKIESMNADRTSELERRAILHAALADPARLRITDTLLAGDASPSELAAMLAMPSNLLAHHLHVLEQAGIITRRRSEGDRRRTYLQLIPGALDSLAPPPARAALRVLFVCTANSAARTWPQRCGARSAPFRRYPLERIRRHRSIPALSPRHAPPVCRCPGCGPATSAGPARRRPRRHGLRWPTRNSPRPQRCTGPSRTRSWPGPGQLRRGLAQLADRVGRLAPRLAAVS